MKIRKGLAFLVAAIFLISAFSLVLAQGDDDNNNKERLREKSMTEAEKENAAGGMRAAVAGFSGLKEGIVQRFMENHPVIVQKFLEQLNQTNRSDIIKNLDRARLQQCLNNTEDCKEKIKNWKITTEKVKDRIRERTISKDKLLEAQNKFLKAKNQYIEMKNSQLRIRNDFLEMKGKLAQCKAKGENCTELENKTFEKAQEELTAIADRLIQHLEKVKSRVESAENLNETEAEEIIGSIDDMIAKLEDVKDAVEGAGTKDELKEAADLINVVWQDMKVNAFMYAEEVIHSRVGEIFARSEILEQKLDDVVKKLQDKGVNTTALEDKLDNFSAKIDDARDKMEQANDLFQEAKDLRDSGDKEGAKEKLEEAKTLTREAHQALKDAHTILMDLVHMINQKGESFDPDEINEDEEVDLVEEEDED